MDNEYWFAQHKYKFAWDFWRQYLLNYIGYAVDYSLYKRLACLKYNTMHLSLGLSWIYLFIYLFTVIYIAHFP